MIQPRQIPPTTMWILTLVCLIAGCGDISGAGQAATPTTALAAKAGPARIRAECQTRPGREPWCISATAPTPCWTRPDHEPWCPPMSAKRPDASRLPSKEDHPSSSISTKGLPASQLSRLPAQVRPGTIAPKT